MGVGWEWGGGGVGGEGGGEGHEDRKTSLISVGKKVCETG